MILTHAHVQEECKNRSLSIKYTTCKSIIFYKKLLFSFSYSPREYFFRYYISHKGEGGGVREFFFFGGGGLKFVEGKKGDGKNF